MWSDGLGACDAGPAHPPNLIVEIFFSSSGEYFNPSYFGG